MFLMWNAIQTANLFKIARETVRQYSGEFAAYLSPQANPGKNRARVFTEADMEVFAFIVEMKSQGKLYSDIHAALMNGQRGSLPDEVSAITIDQPRYTQLQLKITFLEDELKAAETEALQDKREIDVLTRQLESAQAEIKLLNREIGRLEAGIKSPS